MDATLAVRDSVGLLGVGLLVGAVGLLRLPLEGSRGLAAGAKAVHGLLAGRRSLAADDAPGAIALRHIHQILLREAAGSTSRSAVHDLGAGSNGGHDGF